MPAAKRFAYLGPAADPNVLLSVHQLQEAGLSSGASARLLDAGDSGAISRNFDSLATDRVDALIVSGVLLHHRQQLAELAARHMVPAIYAYREHLEAGGLMAYGPNLAQLYQRAAFYVHRILQGAKASDLTIEQSSAQWLGINLRAANALGLAVPAAMMQRADELIE